MRSKRRSADIERKTKKDWCGGDNPIASRYMQHILMWVKCTHKYPRNMDTRVKRGLIDSQPTRCMIHPVISSSPSLYRELSCPFSRSLSPRAFFYLSRLSWRLFFQWISGQAGPEWNPGRNETKLISPAASELIRKVRVCPSLHLNRRDVEFDTRTVPRATELYTVMSEKY